MSKSLEQKAIDWKNDPLNPNIIGLAYINDFKAGYELCQKEYEEKLRWIPVTETLPPEKNNEYTSKLVELKLNSKTYAVGYYDYEINRFTHREKVFRKDEVTHWRHIIL